jgi:hypothetical protein
MSPSAYWLYRELQDGSTPDGIASKIGRRFGQQVSVLTVFIVTWFGYTAVRFIGPFFAHRTSDVAAIGRDFGSGRLADALGRLVGIVPGLIVLIVIAYRLARAAPSLVSRRAARRPAG